MQSAFDKYTIEKKLGQGGMGEVYLALDQTLGRRIALKVITSSDQESVERFIREAQAVAKLKHPHIVQVHEVGQIIKTHYFTMDYIEGKSLESLIKDKTNPLAPKRIAGIIRQISDALHYAHSQGIIHRDIKPSNILVDNKEDAYLTDFGIAKQLTGLDKTLTLTGTTVGTPEYMSPEQAMGKKGAIDHRSDIFSLGATLYHATTGRYPFAGEEIYDIINKLLNTDPAAPRTINQAIPKDLETICLKCLEKEQDKRYQTAGALADDLKRYMDDEPITARRTPHITKLWTRAKKNKAISLSVTGAILVLSAVIIGLMISSARASDKARQFRKEALAYAGEGKYDQSLIACEKLRELTKSDGQINALYDQCLAQLAKQKEATRAKDEKDRKRAEAKAVLDRASAAHTTEDKIRAAQDALKIDSTYGDAYQAIGYAYLEKLKTAGDDHSLTQSEYRELIEKAYEYFSKAIKATPTLAYSYYERARITEYSYKKPEAAIPDYEKTLEYDPNSYIGWYAKGCIEDGQKKYDEAIASYTKVIELYPEYDWAYVNRGFSYNEKNELDKAIADYTWAIRLNPKLTEAYYNRGNSYIKKGELDRAIEDLTQVIRINPTDAEAYANRGSAYYNKTERHELTDAAWGELFDKAIADFNDAISLNHDYAEAYFRRGHAYFDKSEREFNGNKNPDICQALLDKAIADFTRVISITPKDDEAYDNRGSAYYKKTERNNFQDAASAELLDKAMADYDEAIRLNPKNATAYSNRSIVYVKKNELDKAITDFNEAIRLNPNNDKAYNDRGVVYQKKARREPRPGEPVWRELMTKAFADFSEAIRLNPKLAAAYDNRGIVYFDTGNFDQAITDFSEAIRLNPEFAEAYTNRGNALYMKNEVNKAMADWTESIRLNPKLASAYYNRGVAYYNKKEFREAIADLEKALELDPNMPQTPLIRQTLEEMKKQLGK
ncbi:MAG: tetratricopeptide repeat protein [Planctomycetota bacterium]